MSGATVGRWRRGIAWSMGWAVDVTAAGGSGLALLDAAAPRDMAPNLRGAILLIAVFLALIYLAIARRLRRPA